MTNDALLAYVQGIKVNVKVNANVKAKIKKVVENKKS